MLVLSLGRGVLHVLKNAPCAHSCRCSTAGAGHIVRHAEPEGGAHDSDAGDGASAAPGSGGGGGAAARRRDRRRRHASHRSAAPRRPQRQPHVYLRAPARGSKGRSQGHIQGRSRGAATTTRGVFEEAACRNEIVHCLAGRRHSRVTSAQAVLRGKEGEWRRPPEGASHSWDHSCGGAAAARGRCGSMRSRNYRSLTQYTRAWGTSTHAHAHAQACSDSFASAGGRRTPAPAACRRRLCLPF